MFLSADTANPQKLVDKGLADGDPVNFADEQADRHRARRTTRPASRPRPTSRRPGVKVIAAGDEVPITKYATQLVGNLAKESGYPADFAAKYAANIASKEDNVKAVVAKIELGEGDAGIVYVTDAKASDQGRRPSTCPTPRTSPRRTRAWSSRRRSTQKPPRRSSTGSPARTGRRS